MSEAWKYHPAGMQVMSDDGQMTIADIRGFGTLATRFGKDKAVQIMDANGHSIAALPELLEACEDTMRFLERYSDPDSNELWVKVTAAIRKAKGIPE